MLEWIYRGLSKGRITTRYPSRAARPPDGFEGSVAVVAGADREQRVAAACESGTIVVIAGGGVPLARGARGLRRSIHVRHIDTGSDGSEEWEIQALWNPYYDIQRLGFFLTNSPRHADVLLVTGPVTTPMRAPLQRTWEVMPAPKALVAVGTDACGGGLYGTANGEELTAGGVDRVLPVSVYVPGSPPPPIAIMQGLLLTAGILTPEPAAA
jgi:Ni,Fe-hydrogenase III small subunit